VPSTHRIAVYIKRLIDDQKAGREESLLALEGSYPIVMATKLGAFFATPNPPPPPLNLHFSSFQGHRLQYCRLQLVLHLPPRHRAANRDGEKTTTYF
jgi:hypothetical protein